MATFTLFSNLPMEIQDYIWEIACQEQSSVPHRIAHVTPFHHPEPDRAVLAPTVTNASYLTVTAAPRAMRSTTTASRAAAARLLDRLRNQQPPTAAEADWMHLLHLQGYNLRPAADNDVVLFRGPDSSAAIELGLVLGATFPTVMFDLRTLHAAMYADGQGTNWSALAFQPLDVAQQRLQQRLLDNDSSSTLPLPSVMEMPRTVLVLLPRRDGSLATPRSLHNDVDVTWGVENNWRSRVFEDGAVSGDMENIMLLFTWWRARFRNSGPTVPALCFARPRQGRRQ